MYIPPINNPQELINDPTLKEIRPWWSILIGAAILYLPAKNFLDLPMIGPTVDWLASLIPSISMPTSGSPCQTESWNVRNCCVT